MKKTDIKKISRAFNISEKKIEKALEEAQEEIEKTTKEDDRLKIEHSHFYFLPEDMDKVNNRIESLHLEIVRLGKVIGRSCDVSGETFHDNFDYEEGSRQQGMWSEEIKKLTAIKRRAKIVIPPQTGHTVSIGRTIKIDNNGQLMEIKVGSYITFSSESISYASPIIKLIFGAKIGETKEGLVRKIKTKIRILDIK